MKPPNVSIRPYMFQGFAGYRVRWIDAGRVRAYFVLTVATARYVKQRVKAGKTPKTSRYWMVKI